MDDILIEYGIDSNAYGPEFSKLLINQDHQRLKELSVSLAGRLAGKRLWEALTNNTRSFSPINNDSSSRSSSPSLNASAPIFVFRQTTTTTTATLSSSSSSSTSIWNGYTTTLSEDEANHRHNFNTPTACLEVNEESEEDHLPKEEDEANQQHDIAAIIDFLNLDEEHQNFNTIIDHDTSNPNTLDEYGNQEIDLTYPSSSTFIMDQWTGDYTDFSQGQAELELLTPLQELAMIFSHIPSDQILAVLETVGYDMESALDIFMAQPDTNNIISTSSGGSSSSNSSNSNSNSATPGTIKKKQICRHYLSGNGCYRKDCWFSHDLESTLCKYWLQNRCMKGDLCDFSHDTEVLVRARQQQALNVINTSNSSSNRATPSPPPPLGLSPILPKAEEPIIEEEFPSLAIAVTMPQSKKSSRSNSNHSKGKAHKFADVVRKAASKPTPADKDSTVYNRIKSTGINHKDRISKLNLVLSDRPTWVDTGASVAKQYQDARQEAIECAIIRNKLFQRAMEAFKSGDRRLAKQLSMQAHSYNTKMKELHAKASSQLYSARNKSNSNNKKTIDCHGLYPNEAIQMIDKKLQQLRRIGGSIWILVGTGHHSRNSKAKVGPAVREWLTANRYTWREADLGDGRGGCLYVEAG